MQDAPSEAREAAAAIIAEHGWPKSAGHLVDLLSLAYARGARVASQEAAEAVREAVKSA